LNGNMQAWASPKDSFGIAYVVCDSVKNIATVHTTMDGIYSVVVIATRIDPIAAAVWAKTGVEYVRANQ